MKDLLPDVELGGARGGGAGTSASAAGAGPGPAGAAGAPPGAGAAAGPGPPGMAAFYSAVGALRGELRGLEERLERLAALHEAAGVGASSLAQSKAARQELRDEVGETGRAALAVKKCLDRLLEESAVAAEEAGPGSAQARIKQSVLLACQRKLKAAMDEFNALRRALTDDMRSVVARRYEAVHGEPPSAEKLERLVRSGKSESLFKKAILKQGQGAVDDTVIEVNDRHRAMLELERDLDDLGQVVLDFGSLVGEQGALIESIEHHVQRSANFVGKGADALQESKGLHRALQKKRLILAGIICGGAAVVLIVVLLVLNQVLPSFRIGEGGGRRQPPALAPGPAPDWVPVRAPDPNPSPPG